MFLRMAFWDMGLESRLEEVWGFVIGRRSVRGFLYGFLSFSGFFGPGGWGLVCGLLFEVDLSVRVRGLLFGLEELMYFVIFFIRSVLR